MAGTVIMQFAAVYVVVLVAASVSVWHGSDRSLLDWVVLALPATAFVPSTVFAVKAHRTGDPGSGRTTWRRALLLAVIGVALLAGAAVIWRTS